MMALEDVIRAGELEGRGLIIVAAYIEHLNDSNGNRHKGRSGYYRDIMMAEQPHLGKYFARAQAL